MAPTFVKKRSSTSSSSFWDFSSFSITPSKSAMQKLPSVFLLILLLSPLPSISASKYSGSSMGALASPGSSGGSGSGLSSSSGGGSGNSLSAALSATGAVASAAAASSAASAASGPSVGATSNFLYNLMGAASPSSANPYPIRTMIGNMVWRIRQHKTPLMVIPPVLRLLYQFRGPIMTGFNSAFKGIGGGGVGGPGAAAAAAVKGAADLASASSNLASSAVGGGGAGAGAAAFGAAAGAPLMFPGPASFGGGVPGLFGPSGLAAAPGMMPVFKK